MTSAGQPPVHASPSVARDSLSYAQPSLLSGEPALSHAHHSCPARTRYQSHFNAHALCTWPFKSFRILQHRLDININANTPTNPTHRSLPQPSTIMDGFDGDMNIISGADKKYFTKTPANVSADHWDTPPPTSKTVKSQGGKPGGKKRIVAPGESSDEAPKTKKVKKSQGKAIAGPSKAAAAALARPKQKRKPTGRKLAQTRPIPRSHDECDEADKLLLELRDDGGDWKDIRPKWTALTGEKTAPSTLPNRYARIKSNLTIIEEGDNERLLQAKRQVEDTFDATKWELIANIVEEKGGQRYLGLVLKRQYKKLMVSVGTVPPEGIDDPDFLIPELESDDEVATKREKGGGAVVEEDEMMDVEDDEV
ncbi:hypothetical protein AC579_4030 [Pseudocercospora musae]|uniref:Myb-like domain-containing protein n=1 Tax=Pseudocercospora musae TaxID=113226 RepID=A0A139I2Q1_9PEZI|nr:hypothetical protein AC579_4030 [Pseudocercospora musae]